MLNEKSSHLLRAFKIVKTHDIFNYLMISFSVTVPMEVEMFRKYIP